MSNKSQWAFKAEKSAPVFNNDVENNKKLLIAEFYDWSNELKAVISNNAILPYKHRPKYLEYLLKLLMAVHETIDILESGKVQHRNLNLQSYVVNFIED